MRGADLILNDLADEGGAQLGRERECRVLVDRPECVVAAVSAREPEHLRLASAATAARREPAPESGQVQPPHAARRGRARPGPAPGPARGPPPHPARRAPPPP